MRGTWAIAALAVTSGLMLTGCGGEPASSGASGTVTETITKTAAAPTVTVTATVTADPSTSSETSEPAPSPSEATYQMGEEFDLGGLKLTIVSARETQKITYVNGTEVPVRDGGKFIVLEVDGKNRTGAGEDPSCSRIAETAVVDVEGNYYEPDFDIRRADLPDNPECNDIVPTGFDFHTTWVFIAPKSADVTQAVVSKYIDGQYLPPVTVDLKFSKN